MKSEELIVRVFFKEESFHVVAEKKLFSKLLKAVEGRKSLYRPWEGLLGESLRRQRGSSRSSSHEDREDWGSVEDWRGRCLNAR